MKKKKIKDSLKEIGYKNFTILRKEHDDRDGIKYKTWVYVSDNTEIPSIKRKGKLIEEEGVQKRFIIFEDGKILDIEKDTWKKYSVDNSQYMRVRLQTTSEYNRNKGRLFLLHRLIGSAFIPNPENLPEINHKDGNKLNNHTSNLEWCTQQHNVIEAFRIGLRKPVSVHKGENCYISTHTNNEIREIAEYLSLGIGYPAINDFIPNTPRWLVNSIRTRDSWDSAIHDIKFPRYTYLSSLSGPTILRVIKYIKKGLNNDQILDIIGMTKNYNNRSKIENLRKRYILNINSDPI